ncbi:NADPH-dependent FMN reductase [Mucilaginibacter ginsenosidivorans]|uniref:NAD(P)H-dependent oxidoreductase n=1 Tax=Mucilaginibacter ginsenosidivorans TaxID=398053 RepID=A0A5B8V0H3_9SPHI|nr:NADPH-dependent FMN reductase [Mucilaginibacter ginsenosidivorans]QEC64131.1 NAD(P)H-dependent oxidoreductase [Mucilaginibacter ginsenosidivorans]
MKNIFSISGSLRPGSSNHIILEYLKSMVSENITFTIYDGVACIPAFDPGLDNDDPPKTVAGLRTQLSEADAILICTPEYAFGVPGALKNVLDWTVSSGSFSGKATALITASTGGENAHAAMIKILGAIDAKLTPETTLLISFIRTKINDGIITDKQTVEKLGHLFHALLRTIK